MGTTPHVSSAMPPPDQGGMPGIFGLLLGLFVLLVIGSVVLTVVKYTRTRDMALRKGATESEATVLALSGDVGTAAAFIGAKSAAPSAADRIAEVRALATQGLITADQAEQRVSEILGGI